MPRRDHYGGDLRCPEGRGSYTRAIGSAQRRTPGAQHAQPHRHSTSFNRAEMAAGLALITKARTNPELRAMARSPDLVALERKLRAGVEGIDQRAKGGAS